MNKLKDRINRFSQLHSELLCIVAFVIAVVLVVLMMPRSAKFKYEYQKLRPWRHESLYAPFDFPIYKTESQMLADRDEAMKNVHPVFVFDVSSTEKGREDLIRQYNIQHATDDGDDNGYLKLALNIYDSLQNCGVVSMAGSTVKYDGSVIVNIMKNKVITQKNFSELYTMYTVRDAINTMLDTVTNEVVVASLNNLILGSLRQNVIYSSSLTLQAENNAYYNTMPTFGMVQKNELIISKDEIVTEEKYLIISSLQKEYENIYSQSLLGHENILYGQILLVTIIFFCLFMMLRLFRKDIYGNSSLVILMLLLMLCSICMAFSIVRNQPDILNLVPLTLNVMILLVFFDERLTLMTQIITLMLICLAVPNPFVFFFEQLLVSLVMVFVLSRQTSRVQFFRASLSVLVSYIVVNVGIILMFDGEFDNKFILNIVLYIGNAFLTLMALPLIILFEKLSGLPTDIKLLELCNTNTPLLRRLASEAPGTFQHSMQVASLCEEVVLNIGGDAMLARAGALYHDVGKIENPSFFVENQNGKFNPHEDLSNEESAKIIIDHVNDGVDLCEEYNIPMKVIDFVRSHHGTRRTEYFYRLELKDDPDVDEEAFKYHGPPPFTKETAVLMMCDSVEAASRSLPEKSEQSLSNLVDKIIDGQIEAGQYDNTDITYADIKVAKKVLKKKLISIYHARVEYPK